MTWLLFETNSGKWLKIGDNAKLDYTTDKAQATGFSDLLLASSLQHFADFTVFQHTLRAMPIDSNTSPMNCNLVSEVLDSFRESVSKFAA